MELKTQQVSTVMKHVVTLTTLHDIVYMYRTWLY